MDKDVIVIDLRSFKEKRDDISRKAKAKFKKGVEWVKSNKEAVIALAPVVIGGVATVAKVVGKRSNLRKEEQLKERYCYDRSLGHYWKLKRELTTKEWLEVDARRRHGERLADILDDLRVLE